MRIVDNTAQLGPVQWSKALLTDVCDCGHDRGDRYKTPNGRVGWHQHAMIVILVGSSNADGERRCAVCSEVSRFFTVSGADATKMHIAIHPRCVAPMAPAEFKALLANPPEPAVIPRPVKA